MSYEDFQEYIARLRREGRMLSEPTHARWEGEEFDREIRTINVDTGVDPD